MTANTEKKWQVLIIEDDETIAEQIAIDARMGKLIPDIGAIEPVLCTNFAEARPKLELIRFDFLILDLRDDKVTQADDASAGLELFKAIKELRFVPIVFYTALPHKVEGMETSFVRIVEKTEGLPKLRSVLKQIFETGLPSLLRHLEEEQRTYMWDFVEENWESISNDSNPADITYLLARRLAHALSRSAIKRLGEDSGYVIDDSDMIHPTEMYIMPPNNDQFISGDILFGSIGDHKDKYWAVITPTCDFAQEKVELALVARCTLLSECKEYKDYASVISKGDTPSNSITRRLEALLKDSRQGKKVQSDRYKYLPGAFTLPDLVVDFQNLVQLPLSELDELEKKASLDSPFSEALLSRFSRYYGRLGTPDLNIDMVMERLN